MRYFPGLPSFHSFGPPPPQLAEVPKSLASALVEIDPPAPIFQDSAYYDSVGSFPIESGALNPPDEF